MVGREGFELMSLPRRYATNLGMDFSTNRKSGVVGPRADTKSSEDILFLGAFLFPRDEPFVL
jgi:hypothetical protein